jgi:hypothetical protein
VPEARKELSSEPSAIQTGDAVAGCAVDVGKTAAYKNPVISLNNDLS